MANQKINRQQLFLEFVSVVFAVLLALFLNGWRESYNIEKALVKVKETIRQETIRNDSLVRKSFDYRTNLIKKFYANTHLLMKSPVSSIPVEVNDDKKLESYFNSALIFDQKFYADPVKVLRKGQDRVLIIGESIFDIAVENDSIALYGVGNIQLRAPDLSNRSWDIAQATGTLVEMDIELVEQLSKINMLIQNYQTTSDNAINMIYAGASNGILSVLEDMRYFEIQIIKQDSVLLEMLD